MKDSILYVDDRLNNLNSFKATFRREYDVYIAENPRDALKVLEQRPIKVAVADYKMPEITGVTFLEIVKKQYPDTVRIMLTGHADLPAVVEAINRSEIFRFLAKPWNEKDLRNGIKSAIELYDTRQLLAQKNEELKKAYNELDRLVFSTAHDITGPLSNVLGLVNIIRSEPENTLEYLELIERTTKKLQFIARDVLSFHRNKRTELRIKKINIQKVIEDTVADHQFFENIGDLQYEINVTSPVAFYSDVSRLRFILNNLISNAIKYQDSEKSVNWVKVSFSNDESRGVLQVEDNGVGIEADILPKIFEIYYRASNQSTGAGIGLYIATEAVNLLHGTISVESEKGVGTKFTIELPNAKTQDLEHTS